MDGVRYLLALFLVLLAPGVFLYWFSIHPFIRFWRSVGPRLTIVIHYGFILILAAGVFLIRKPLLSIEFGANPVLIVLAVPLYVLVIVLRVQLSKQVGTKVCSSQSRSGQKSSTACLSSHRRNMGAAS
jgi:hypothetical protein